MKIHTMNLNPDALKLIKDGSKTIEMRLYDEKRRAISKGDNIIFINTENQNATLKVKVIKLHIFNSFDELYKAFDKIKLGYEEIDVALPSDMERYYHKEDIDKYGVIGIEIEVI